MIISDALKDENQFGSAVSIMSVSLCEYVEKAKTPRRV